MVAVKFEIKVLEPVGGIAIAIDSAGIDIKSSYTYLMSIKH